MKKFLAYALTGFFGAMIFTEALLRFLPVNSGLRYLPIDSSNPILRGKPFSRFTYSKGWNFRLTQQGILNNDGFISSVPFVQNPSNILLIGDSWVEAIATNPDENLGAELSRRLKGVSVYPLGTSAAKITDYLALAKWGIEKYKPKAVIFLISVNDLDEVTKINPGGYNFQSQLGNDCKLIQQKTPEHRPLIKALISTKLFRYLFTNLTIVNNLQKSFSKSTPESKTVLDSNPHQYVRSHASQCFVNQINKIASERKILVVFHNRKGDDDLQILADMLVKTHIPTVDLTNILNSFALRTGQHLDYLPTDGHWNALGQAMSADYLAPVLSDLLSHHDQSSPGEPNNLK